MPTPGHGGYAPRGVLPHELANARAVIGALDPTTVTWLHNCGLPVRSTQADRMNTQITTTGTLTATTALTAARALYHHLTDVIRDNPTATPDGRRHIVAVINTLAQLVWSLTGQNDQEQDIPA